MPMNYVDRVNRTFITSVMLTLNAPTTLGLANSAAVPELTGSHIDQVIVSQNADLALEKDLLAGEAGAVLTTLHPKTSNTLDSDGTAIAYFVEGAVLSNTTAKLSVSATPNTTYPTPKVLTRLYPQDKVGTSVPA